MSGMLASLRGVSVAYRVNRKETVALADIDLDIPSGSRLAIIGESGSGKSTLALAMAELLPPNATVRGSIDWPGLDKKPAAGSDIGFVFQDAGASLNPVLRVGEQIAEVAKRHLGRGWSAAEKRARDLIARVGLPKPAVIANAYPHQLSGGQRQRIAIAAAVAAKPKLLIADEPTSALDMIVQAEIVALLNDLVREDGMTMMFITHDIALASGFADRIAVLRGGRLIETGTTAEVLSGPKDAYTRQLLDSHIELATPPLVDTALA